MTKYHKIQTIFKRVMEKGPDRGKLIYGDWTKDEFRALKDCPWSVSEKIDGTNIRVYWDAEKGTVEIKGRTDNAQLHVGLIQMLSSLFTAEKFEKRGYPTMVIYGEGVGGKIQKDSHLYCRPGMDFDFIGFDVAIGGMFLKDESCDSILENLGARPVHRLANMTLPIAIGFVQEGHNSFSRAGEMEGLVLRAPCGILDRQGNRIICKIKTKDFVDMIVEYPGCSND